MLDEQARELQYAPDNTPAPEEVPVRRWEPLLAWAAAWLIFLALLPNILDKLNPVTGDEPFYLVTAISLLHDRDLDEANNYAKKDYWLFAPSCKDMERPNWGNVGEIPINNVPGVLAPGLRNDCANLPLPLDALSDLPPHSSKGTMQPGQYTKHGIGLSVLIAPAFALGNRVLVVILIAALAALVGVNIWLLAFETTGRRPVAWLSWALMTFTTPLLSFSFLIFPAIPAALLTVYAWRRLRLSARAQQLNQPDRQPNDPLRSLAIGACIGFLPWLHSVYLVLSLFLFAYWLLGGRAGRWLKKELVRRVNRADQIASYRQPSEKLNLAWIFPRGWPPLALASFFMPLFLLGVLFVAFYMYYYGTPIPNTQDHAGFAPLIEIPSGFLGLLFDQKYGLLIYAPCYLLAFCGLWLMARRQPDRLETAVRRSDLLWLGLVGLTYVLVMSDYKQWWGEWGPPARYLVPAMPLLAVPLSLALAELKGWPVKAFLGLAAAWSVAFAALFMYNPHVMYNWQTSNPATALRWIEANMPFMKEANLGRFFPSYVTNLNINANQPNWLAALAWILGAVFLGAALVYFGSREFRTLKDPDKG
jgi:hypothetical protein